MKRLLMTLSLLLVPMAIQAQDQSTDHGPRSAATDGALSLLRLDGSLLTAHVSNDADAATGEASSTATQARPAVVPSKRPVFRRHGSMVGYVDDATVETNARIRFEAGFHDDVPDRAEFFYAKCGCYRDLPPTDPAFDPNAPGPRPGAVTDLNFQQLYFLGQFAFTDRISGFAELPFRWIQPQAFSGGTAGFSSQGGVSDLRAGVKYGLMTTPEQLLTAQVKAYFPSGNAQDGLGTNHTSFEPSIMYTRSADRLMVESEFGVWMPAGRSAPIPITTSGHFSGSVLFYGVGPSYEVYSRNGLTLAPVIELVGWSVLGGFQTAASADAGGTNIVNLKFGARVSFDPHASFYIGYGHALTSAVWYTDILRVEYRYSF